MPKSEEPVSAAEYGAQLADLSMPLTEDQVESAARILASVPPEEAQEATGDQVA